ncbi:hypothetical protein C8A00DRAFT_30326 [Chaetomidium leptoderma]|uniref:Uncharacterized protein n=1 Tax=Chaetomidium leptoderma TaxID=669021 RepID=A0AAN6VTU6_9PEZI|nr:hypothetical protein C8A00DRAFT_30326 [Chaetomidium leptoderma]
MPSTNDPILKYDPATWPLWFVMLSYEAKTRDVWEDTDPDAPGSNEIIKPVLLTPNDMLVKRRDEISKEYQERCAIWEALPEATRGDKPSRAADPTYYEIIELTGAQNEQFVWLLRAWDSGVTRRGEVTEWIYKTVESKLMGLALIKMEADGLISNGNRGLVQTLRALVAPGTQGVTPKEHAEAILPEMYRKLGLDVPSDDTST